MEFLPNDILTIIIDQLDILSLVMLNMTSKSIYKNIGFSSKLSKKPIQYNNHHYANLKNIIEDIVAEIRHDHTQILYKEYTTVHFHKQYALHIYRKIRNKSYNYGFSIQRNHRSSVSFLFDLSSKKYQCHTNNRNIPLLFLFIGCKVLFELHGYHHVSNLTYLPPGISKILLKKNFNGMMFNDIIHGFIKI